MGKHKKEKKRRKRRHSSSNSESSNEEWVEKEATINANSSEDEQSEKGRVKSSISSSEDKDGNHPNLNRKATMSTERDEWMSLPTSFFSASNLDRRQEREEKSKTERERQQYNPRQCPRELNPHWKDGGDGLPKFKKPSDDDHAFNSTKYLRDKKYSNRQSSWRKKKEEHRAERRRSTENKEDINREPEGNTTYSRGDNYSNRQSGWRKKKEEPRAERKESAERETDIKGEPERNKEQSDKQNEDHGINFNKTNETRILESSSVLSEKELNALAAKVVKAEIMGNAKLAAELKLKLETARTARQQAPTVEDVLLVQTDSQGRSQPLKQRSEYGEASGSSKKKTKAETHKDGQRVRYFADDDKYSLKEMFENEKFNTVEDQNRAFLASSSKIKKNDDFDDIFSDEIRKKESDSKVDSRNKDRAIAEHKKITKSLDNCRYCIQSDAMEKHLMVSMGETTYLSLPTFEPLTDGHCFIVPTRHVPCSTQLDENEWADILDMRKALVKMFRAKEMDVIFFEVAKNLHRYSHMAIECVPLPLEQGDLAPIYFKKAIDESETEWAMNKKLVSLSGRDVRKAIPKGLPYFSVSFGMQEGYAHVIEDEKFFPANFAQEIIGGMLDLDHSKWRKPRKQKFEEQSKRVVKFSKEWAKYDCTVK